MSITKEMIQLERSKHNRSRSKPISCLHFARDITKIKQIKFHGIFKSEK